jgi:hypothetical protein
MLGAFTERDLAAFFEFIAACNAQLRLEKCEIAFCARSPSEGVRSVRIPDCEIIVLITQLPALPVVLSGLKFPPAVEARPLTWSV